MNMKKNNHQRLLEMMEKVNPDYKPSNPREEEIIDDILSLDEGVNDIISKMKNYARKGLLTATIIISVASAVAAGNVGGDNIDYKDVIEKGSEMVDTSEQKEIYSFYVGLAKDLGTQAKSESKLEAAKAFGNIAEFYQLKRDGYNPSPLDEDTKKYMKFMDNMMENMSPEYIEKFKEQGKGRYKPAR